MCMAQAWHNSRRHTFAPGMGEAKCWRASEYKITKNATEYWTKVEATANAEWVRYSPFALYQPASKARHVESGPHLPFLKLNNVLEERPELFDKALQVFVRNYGFMGALEQDYDLRRPIRPEGKAYIAPEAVIDDRGRIRLVDPATEGKELLLDLLEKRHGTYEDRARRLAHERMALPDEALFKAKHPDLSCEWYPIEPRQLVPWEDIKWDFGAIMVLDEEAFQGVSVLGTQEPVGRWVKSLKFFPSGDTPADSLVSQLYTSLNSYLQEVSPRVVIGEDGSLNQSWKYDSLIEAMYIMIYLDLTGGSTIKKCRSRGCSNYFRIGSQSKSIYCSERCASRASTRKRRGQQP